VTAVEHPRLNLPFCNLELRSSETATEVFDSLRKQWLVLTPEEWVRQHMLHYLTDQLSYPIGLTAIEKGFELNGIPYRADIVTYDRSGSAILVVECKAPSIKLGQKAFDQIGQYNKVIEARYLVVSNGLEHFCVGTDAGQWKQLNHIPPYAA